LELDLVFLGTTVAVFALLFLFVVGAIVPGVYWKTSTRAAHSFIIYLQMDLETNYLLPFLYATHSFVTYFET
jgi:hypothetical protein